MIFSDFNVATNILAEHLIAHSGGDLLYKAEGQEQLITWELDMSEYAKWKSAEHF